MSRLSEAVAIMLKIEQRDGTKRIDHMTLLL